MKFNVNVNEAWRRKAARQRFVAEGSETIIVIITDANNIPRNKEEKEYTI